MISSINILVLLLKNVVQLPDELDGEHISGNCPWWLLP